jgi:hypothetical protein
VTLSGLNKIPVPHKHFSHLFNAYIRYLQIRTGRTGNLFERPFKRKLIDNEEYLKSAVLYIHNNPVHHSFCSHPLEYPWTSYFTSISNKPTKLKRDEVIKLFNKKENFKQQHNQKIDIVQIEKCLKSHLRICMILICQILTLKGLTTLSGRGRQTLSACAAPDNVNIIDDNVDESTRQW